MNIQKNPSIVTYTLTLTEDELVALGYMSYVLEVTRLHNHGFYSQLPHEVRNRIHNLSPKRGDDAVLTVRFEDSPDIFLSWFGD